MNTEIKRLNLLISEIKAWETKRNRDRVAEIWSLFERNKTDIQHTHSSLEVEE